VQSRREGEGGGGGGGAVTDARRRLTGWGRTAPTAARVDAVRSVDDAVDAVRAAGRGGRVGRGIIARGLGRSYGDPAQNAGGVVLDLTPLDTVHHVDPDAATVEVAAGVSLDRLLRDLLPYGLWIPVLPGTRQVTVGGAVAADVHGKNHHVDGSFGSHVASLDLVTADGTVRRCGPDGPDAELFWATVGGMGLTGVVVRATLRLHRVESAYFVVDTERACDLDDLIDRLDRDDAAYPYSVAWFDSVATGSRLGRAVITRGRSARADELPPAMRRDPLRFDGRELATVPPGLPSGLLNRLTARAFNELWFRKAPALRRDEIQDITTFFHPLDIVAEWNRAYGRHGFCQYQFVVPFGAEEALREAVGRIAGSGHVSCLNVLKRFGPGDPAPLSFPTSGWTLAVDLPVRPGLDGLFGALDELVLDAGGRVYLAKDARLPATAMERMYPRLDEFRKVRHSVDPDGLFRSDLARRLDL
jgi:decaprenylphospho-beta-D-ribofuranose 2-oxidase